MPILNAGYNFYRGAANNLPSSLALCGHPCPGNTNPADHVMFLIQTLPADQIDEIVRKVTRAHTGLDRHSQVAIVAAVGVLTVVTVVAAVSVLTLRWS